MTTIIVFGSSLFLASGFVLIKAVELKYGRRNFILEIMAKLNSKSENFVSTLKFKVLQLVQSVRYIVLVKSKIVFKDLLDRAVEKILKEYKARQGTIIMGHKNISNNGAASFFLRKITEEKSNGTKGKIEESL